MNKSKKFIVFFSALEFTNNKMEKALEIVEKYKIETIEDLINNSDFLSMLSTEEYHNLVKKSDEILNFIENIENSEIAILTQDDEEYPKTLLGIDDAPKVLYAKGDLSLLNDKGLAIVGTRMPSNYGVYVTNKFAEDLAKAGFVIISGLAYGVDSISHKKALEVGGKTIAVLGSGFNHIYPEAHTNLANEIAEKGLLLSEYSPFTRPTKFTFPKRNRIIAGLSQGILIIEASARSGTIHTKEFALDYGKDLFAVPGNINSLKSELPNSLIKSGQAECVLTSKDILDYYGIDIKKENKKVISLNFEEQMILDLLKDGEKDFDELAKKSNISVNILNSYLTTLEIRGLIKRMPAKTFMLN